MMDIPFRHQSVNGKPFRVMMQSDPVVLQETPQLIMPENNTRWHGTVVKATTLSSLKVLKAVFVAAFPTFGNDKTVTLKTFPYQAARCNMGSPTDLIYVFHDLFCARKSGWNCP